MCIYEYDRVYRRSRPLSRYFCQHFGPYFGVRLNGQCYFSVRNQVIGRKKFNVSSRQDSSLDPDANGHQSSFGVME